MYVDENVLQDLIQYFNDINDPTSARAISQIFDRHYGHLADVQDFDNTESSSSGQTNNAAIEKEAMLNVPFFGRSPFKS